MWVVVCLVGESDAGGVDDSGEYSWMIQKNHEDAAETWAQELLVTQ